MSNDSFAAVATVVSSFDIVVLHWSLFRLLCHALFHLAATLSYLMIFRLLSEIVYTFSELKLNMRLQIRLPSEGVNVGIALRFPDYKSVFITNVMGITYTL